MGQPPMIDFTDPTAVVKEIFDDDLWVKDEFGKHLSKELLGFAEILAASFKKFPQIDSLAGNDEQAAFVAGFIHGVFDDLIVSMKLLVSGKLMASGNLMRQAIEGVGVAVLCTSALVWVRRGKGNPIRVKYWERVKRGDSLVQSHKVIEHLELNCEDLGLNRAAVEKLKKARKHYHQFSHPGMLGMATRMSLGECGPIYIGGSFDEAKLEAYKVEIAERTGLCGILPNLLDTMALRLKAKVKEGGL